MKAILTKIPQYLKIAGLRICTGLTAPIEVERYVNFLMDGLFSTIEDGYSNNLPEGQKTRLVPCFVNMRFLDMIY